MMQQTMHPIEIGIVYHQAQYQAQADVPQWEIVDIGVDHGILPHRCEQQHDSDPGEYQCALHRMPDLPEKILLRGQPLLDLKMFNPGRQQAVKYQEGNTRQYKIPDGTHAKYLYCCFNDWFHILGKFISQN